MNSFCPKPNAAPAVTHPQKSSSTSNPKAPELTFAAAPIPAPTKGLVRFDKTDFKTLVPSPAVLSNSAIIAAVLSPSNL